MTDDEAIRAVAEQQQAIGSMSRLLNALLDISTLGPGLPVPGAPVTVQVYVPLPFGATMLVLADGTGSGSVALGIPFVSSFVGLPVATQVIAFDPAMPDPLPLGTSVGMQLLVGN